ncbi:hypothetical protein IW261DRAFT_1129557 [Armillaria novae-zelandiae]|uniref:Uncharacterized protein n=1 Tax=Armillaria novae-zelandiae TaxID=153914 RepID=A0AA39PAG1_9AGAR|nr:hypothetical protein IW261DRAFT_1129557 [Armillaria novae-zelandiae]
MVTWNLALSVIEGVAARGELHRLYIPPYGDCAPEMPQGRQDALSSALKSLYPRSQGLVPGGADHRFSLPGTLLNAKDLLRVLCFLKRRDYGRKFTMLVFY